MLMKRKNRLLDYDMIIYQDDDWFQFSLDSVLLANFVTINLRCKRIIDLASGNAPIPMILSTRTNAFIDAIELQECVYELGKESILENHLEDRIHLILGDVRKIQDYYSSDTFDTVVCNPPYFNTNDSGYLNFNEVKKIARHEVTLNLDSVLFSARYLLKNGGNFAMVYRCDRLIYVIESLKKYGLEPKKIQFIYSKSSKNSDLFLIEATKNGKSGLKVLPGYIVNKMDGSYTDHVKRLFSNIENFR